MTRLSCFLVLAVSLNATAANKKPMISDADVQNIAYNGPKVPEGFYTEIIPEKPKTSFITTWATSYDRANRRVIVHHAKTVKEAQKIAQQHLKKSRVPAEARKILSSKTTDHFFELRSKYQVRGHTYWRHLRVWRSDFFQPTRLFGVGLPGKVVSVKAGVFKAKPTAKNVQWLAEFLWWNGNHNHVGSNVLNPPKVTETADTITVSIPTLLKVGGDFGVGDVLHVQHWSLTVDKKTGEATHAVKPLKKIAGKRNKGGGIRRGRIGIQIN
jgi:hypothetical protein